MQNTKMKHKCLLHVLNGWKWRTRGAITAESARLLYPLSVDACSSPFY